ncbi:haloacid dehalogenase [Candidatus Woesearchaeota archaeon]|nr:cation-transporting P-type ATPase [Candidatus Woesearchaeota archaeon]RLE42580.1 MAG: haloacid dehalogenase [Candidatus Woesearchaeota archaeon]
MVFHCKAKEEVLEELGSNEESGLSQSEAQERREKYGPNKIIVGKPLSPFKIFINQFRNILVLILIIAAIGSYLIGLLPGHKSQLENTVLILIILFFNGVFGFVQNYKAERSIQALKNMSVTKAKVLRDGKVHLINPEDIVPGDIVLLEQGDKVPADIRLISADALSVDESILTGESMPVTKGVSKLQCDTPLAERYNMVYMNTIITRGNATGVVVATGRATEIGKIAKDVLTASEKKTPFTKELDKLGKRIGYIITGLIIMIAIVQLLIGKADFFTIIMVAISLGVAAIPEGLPAVVTLAMAIGTRKMLKRNALVRKLSVVESLGSVDVICTDKTGTLTENRMTVREIFFNNNKYKVTGVGYSAKGEFLLNGKQVDTSQLKPILEVALNCNNARESVDDKGEVTYIGDPTEIALLVCAQKAGLTQGCKRVHEKPFSPEAKFMVTVHETNGRVVAYIKGAPEVVLSKSSHILDEGGVKPLAQERKQYLLSINDSMAKSALRVLGFGYKELPQNYTQEDLEQGFVFLGLCGMMDPPREGVKESIRACIEAGIEVKMITGDNLLTAVAVAKEVGLGTRAINGNQLEQMSEEELKRMVSKIDIFARVSPSHKVRVLKALKANGCIVGMTGDGVNDAPALKNSDVGIGMGVRGSDLAKETSDMVLLDDNFVTIKNAIEEGRTIFFNIRKFVNYLLTTNIAEVLVVFIVSLFGKLAITPVQLLWINLLTDGLPALALGVDPTPPGIMKKRPIKHGEGIINKRVLVSIFGIGCVLTAITIPLFFIGLRKSLVMAQTMVFSALVVYEFLRIVMIREQERLSLFSNKWLLLALLTSIALQLVVLYSWLARYFGVVPLGAFEWLLIVAFGAIGYLASVGLTWWIVKRWS